MVIVSTCRQCGWDIEWIPCPTGGWWARVIHPRDNHEAVRGPRDEWMDNSGYFHTTELDPEPEDEDPEPDEEMGIR
jgi:hypothetical protein